MKLNFKDILVPTATLLIICVVASALLGLTNFLTEEKIAQVQAEKEQQSRTLVLPGAESFTEEGDYFVGQGSGGTVGYVFVTESGGYGGKVQVMTGISAEGEITGIVILAHSETPGLGANCTNDSFAEKYLGQSGQLEVVKNQPAGEGQIEAMTGATITTKAVTDAVNMANAMYEDIVKGGN